MRHGMKFIGMATLAAAAFSGPALAEQIDVDGQRSDVRTAYVGYGDLDLTTSRGEHRLTTRVLGAVRSVCSVNYGEAPIHRIRDRNCHNDSWERAKPQVALAVTRAKQLAMTGKTDIPPVVIALSFAN